MGLGLDRLVMQLLGADSLRDVIAFPKVQNASELMTDCPSAADTKQLDELHLKIVE
jgi:aspartyl-tRNA synthetase